MRFLIVFCVAIMIASCNTSPSKKVNNTQASDSIAVQDTVPVMTFNKVEHDFGTINEGDVVETVFTFTNTGTRDLLILNARGSCGCTVPKYPKNIAIKPGESGEIEVNFDSNGRPSLQQKMVKVSANTLSGGELLRIQAFVEPKNN